MREEIYRAIQVNTPGKFEMVERAVTQAPPGKVRIRVEACGACHTDAVNVNGLFPNIAYPRVSGHEVIGKIDALGRGDFVSCLNQSISGVSSDGGYAEVVVANEHALTAVPDELSANDAAPLLCGGLNT
jgi:propanol-preferring alcohol dehydrogenase